MTKRQEENDAVMLRKILEYDRKLFVFSLNQDPSGGSNGSPSLHHNSRVTQLKTTTKIDDENKQIHFRITKAKSLYGKEQLRTFRQSPSSRTFLMKSQASDYRLKPRIGSLQKLRTHLQE